MLVARPLVFAIAMLLLAGCAAVQGTLTVERYLDREITGDTLNACTARSYQAIARRKAWRDRNFADAVWLVDKAQAAQAGDAPDLFAADRRTSDAARVSALTQAAATARALLAQAGRDACGCGGVAAAYDDWVLLALTDAWDDARVRFDAAAHACRTQP